MENNKILETASDEINKKMIEANITFDDCWNLMYAELGWIEAKLSIEKFRSVGIDPYLLRLCVIEQLEKQAKNTKEK